MDLAGSEKVQKTGATGDRLAEARRINTSLLALGNVLSALTQKGRKRHVPYRDSTLTLLLQVMTANVWHLRHMCRHPNDVSRHEQNSFGGNTRTSLVVNVSPSSYNSAESLSTLRFGDRANKIRNTPQQNQKTSVAQLKKMIELANNKLFVREIVLCFSWVDLWCALCVTSFEQNVELVSTQTLVANLALAAESMLLQLHHSRVRELSRVHPVRHAVLSRCTCDTRTCMTVVSSLRASTDCQAVRHASV